MNRSEKVLAPRLKVCFGPILAGDRRLARSLSDAEIVSKGNWQLAVNQSPFAYYHFPLRISNRRITRPTND